MRQSIVLAGAAMALAAAPVLLSPTAARAQAPTRIDIAIGKTDFISQVNPATDFRLDVRSGLSLLPLMQRYFTLQPFLGVEATTRDSFWGGAGLELDAHWGHWFISPTIAVGGYSRGQGKNLGSTLEFRTTAEAGWRFDNGLRVGMIFSHTSNANIVRINPGTEALLVSMQVPVGALLGN